MTKRQRHIPPRGDKSLSSIDRGETASVSRDEILPAKLGVVDGPFLAAATALLFARMVTATEGAVLGDTLWIALIWLILAALWAGTRHRIMQSTWRDASTWLLGLVVIGHALSTIVVFREGGDRRSAINLLFEWCSLFASWIVLRGVFSTHRRQAALASVLISLTVGLSVLGIWQHFVWYPRMAREYTAVRSALDDKLAGKASRSSGAEGNGSNPETVDSLQRKLAAMGAPQEGSARMLWENRLRDSSEPFGMFALANTFAGLLSFWLLFALARSAGRIVKKKMSSGASREGRLPRIHREFWLLLAICLPVGACLILTKSRTAWVATAFGGAIIGVLMIWRGLARSRKAVSNSDGGYRSSGAIGERIASQNVTNASPSENADSRRAISFEEPLPPEKLLSPSTSSLRRLVMIGCVAIIVFAATGWLLASRLDAEVISEAPKSLQYRLQYWDGALRMLRDRWFFGTGPGNFRPHYLGHKRADSSEEIADPHNWPLDLWSSGGLIALCGGIGLFAWSAGKLGQALARRHSPEKTPEVIQVVELPYRDREGRALMFGGLAGLAICGVGPWILGADFDLRLMFLAAACAVFTALEFWGQVTRQPVKSGAHFSDETERSSSRDSRSIEMAGGVACLALLVHLLGAGGIEMPAIVQLLLVGFLFLAGTERDHSPVKEFSDSESSSENSTGGRVPLVFATTCGLLALCCLVWGVWPVWRRQVLSDTGTAGWVNRGDAGMALRHFELAAQVDPWSSEPWEKIAELNFARWKQEPTARAAGEWFEYSVDAQRQAIERNRAEPHGYRRLGEKYLARVQQLDRLLAGELSGMGRQQRDNDLDAAVTAFEQAAERYPNSALIQSLWAEAAMKQGSTETARERALRALELDDITHREGHVDKYLSGPVRKNMEKLSK